MILNEKSNRVAVSNVITICAKQSEHDGAQRKLQSSESHAALFIVVRQR